MEEYCWAVTEELERPYFGLPSYSVLEFGFQLKFVLHTYSLYHIYVQFQCAHNLSYAGT